MPLRCTEFYERIHDFTLMFYLPGHYSSDLIGTTMASSAKVKPSNWLSVQEMFRIEGGNT